MRLLRSPDLQALHSRTVQKSVALPSMYVVSPAYAQ